MKPGALFAGISRYEVIAFATGFILMAYELVASRLLAPSIGSSTYVWTSVIGVMIAALALGYAVGGWIADKRVAVQDVALLLLLSAIMIAATLVMYEGVLALITNLLDDARIEGVVAALALFMPASFLLGTISPYLARLRVKSVTTAGRSVASLSALNSVGGIVGTFVTGFVLFSTIGSRESLALLVLLLLVCSWVLVPRRHVAARSIATGIVVVLVAMELVPPAHAAVRSVDTPSSHYQISTATYGSREIRALTTGPAGAQSAIYTDGSRQLVFPYTRKMADVVAAVPQKDRILMLGGGVFTLPEHLAYQYPQAQVDVVEIDPALVTIAKEHFNYSSPPNVHIITDDARAFVQKATTSYDIILVDVFNELSVPFSLTTREFTERLKALLQPNGVVVVNIIAGLQEGCEPLLTSIHGSYRHAFAAGELFPLGAPDMQERQNIIGVYGASLPWLGRSRAYGDIPPAAQVLTDNFAPAEAMVQHCH